MEPNNPENSRSEQPELSAPPPLPPGPPPSATRPRRPSASSSRANRPKGRAGWIIATILFAGLLVISLMFNFVAMLFSGGGSTHYTMQPSFMEVVLEDNGSRNKIAVLNLTGVISGQPYGAGGYSLVSYFKDQLEACAEDSQIKGVVLKVDSPGGEVLASDEIAALIEDFQGTTGKPVVSSMGSLAASGGYYVSAPCRWIVANELTMTGSIGVIMSGYNWRGLMDKVGIEPMVFKSGDLKDMLSPDKRPDEVTDEERAIVQGIISATYERFTEVVSEGRKAAASANGGDGQALADDWTDYADGRILTGTQAYDLGLVDELGNFDTAVARAQRLAQVANANLVTFQEPFRLGSLFRLLGETEANTVKIDLGLDVPKLEAGKLYFLPPHLLP